MTVATMEGKSGSKLSARFSLYGNCKQSNCWEKVITAARLKWTCCSMNWLHRGRAGCEKSYPKNRSKCKIELIFHQCEQHVTTPTTGTTRAAIGHVCPSPSPGCQLTHTHSHTHSPIHRQLTHTTHQNEQRNPERTLPGIYYTCIKRERNRAAARGRER